MTSTVGSRIINSSGAMSSTTVTRPPAENPENELTALMLNVNPDGSR